MAGPQVQRPHSAYYSGLNGSNGVTSGMVTSTSTHTNLHAIRTISHDSELIYRGSNGNPISTGDPCTAGTSHSIIPQQHLLNRTGSNANISSIAGTGKNPSDALIVPAGNLPASNTSITNTATTKSTYSLKSSTKEKQCSLDVIVDASQSNNNQLEDDVEQGKSRRSSRHRHRPLHRRFLNYLKTFFNRTTTQHDSELEEFETPARYRPDSLSALSRSTRFTEDEIKRIYRGFKAECPTGVVKEDTFKVIYSQFFPQGGSYGTVYIVLLTFCLDLVTNACLFYNSF
uniref:Uncharacterized protein n=1 Tax=Glossina palpalis gambiensis TaxID=67801 RepID=A0A1B0AX79_9MUSC